MGAFSYFQKKKSPEPTQEIALDDGMRIETASSIAPSQAEDPYHHIRQGDMRKGQHAGFKSYRLIGTYEQPWLADKRMKRTWINNVIVWGFVILAMLISAYINFAKARTVVKLPYCLILEDRFTEINPSVWGHEIQTGGYGTGSFDWTTDDPANSFISPDGLHIQPTLTRNAPGFDNDKILNGYQLNLTKDGTCTSDEPAKCVIFSNTTLGTILPPVRSARLSTKGKKTIKYGKVEVVAKLPRGDWLWPAIWMMPENSEYGQWPRSGEIDIVEARGNDVDYPSGGRDTCSSTIHWGPSTTNDAYWRATRGKAIRRSDFSDNYHTFGLVWTKDYLFTYLDFQLQQVSYWSFKTKKSMWQRGQFSTDTTNGTLMENPWGASGNVNAPFDKEFYLILNLAVGGQNGYFPDTEGSKPWVDVGKTAARDFWKAEDQWLPTWGSGTEASLNVQSVKMWQEGDCA